MIGVTKTEINEISVDKHNILNIYMQIFSYLIILNIALGAQKNRLIVCLHCIEKASNCSIKRCGWSWSACVWTIIA